MPMVRFGSPAKGTPLTVEVSAGTTLLAAARQAGVLLESPCNGTGTCGKCRVRVDAPGNLRRVGSHPLPESDAERGWALACHAEVRADVTVEVPEGREEGLRILSDGTRPEVDVSPWIRKEFDPAWGETRVFAGPEVIAREPWDTSEELYGLVVDIGTTTLVASLVDLCSGLELGSASALNPQALHAQDVLSRIQLGSEPEGLGVLQRELLREANRLTTCLTAQAGVRRELVYEAVFSGNTTMLHLAVGADPRSLGKYPYTPALEGGTFVAARELGLRIAPAGLVYLPPILSAYVGADITSGILATSLHRRSGTTLFVDVGTNGEMVLAVEGELTATSTAAGPAFEGMNIECGMRATAGAVERFEVSEEGVSWKTIGAAEPAGLCGSGLVDLVGELAAHGALDRNGRFAKPNRRPIRALRERFGEREGRPLFHVTGPIVLPQKDVRQVQLAKGAVRAGIELLLEAEGLDAPDVDRVLVAGSFGYHLRTKSLVNLGLLPAVLADRVEFVG
ncbi:MAG: DUF4445 domain-containing protein, partial [Deltaproteobacteria bacterium]|nr:DUF4445 domain-containing protein [Deltaproteobacteria bacterium]